MFMYTLITLYALLTLPICIPAGKVLQQWPEMRGAAWMIVAILAWPLLLILGMVALAIGFKPPPAGKIRGIARNG
jgi:hypothetical protein